MQMVGFVFSLLSLLSSEFLLLHPIELVGLSLPRSHDLRLTRWPPLHRRSLPYGPISTLLFLPLIAFELTFSTTQLWAWMLLLLLPSRPQRTVAVPTCLLLLLVFESTGMPSGSGED